MKLSLINSKLMLIPIIFGALLAVMALSQSAYAGAECASLGGACDDGGWDPMKKLDEIGNPTSWSRTVRTQMAGEVEGIEMEHERFRL